MDPEIVITDEDKTDLEWLAFNLKEQEVADHTYMVTILKICKELQRLEKENKKLEKERNNYKSEVQQLELMMNALTE